MTITEYNFEHFILSLWLFLLGYLLFDVKAGLLAVFGLLSVNLIMSIWQGMNEDEDEEEGQ